MECNSGKCNLISPLLPKVTSNFDTEIFLNTDFLKLV